MEQPTPTFRRLVTHDKNFQTALFMAMGPVIVLAYSIIRSGEFLNTTTIFLVGVSLLGAIWLTYQYLLIMATFRDGVTIKGNIIHTEVKSQSRQKGGRSYTYYAFLGYTINNEVFERRVRLPGNPELYGLAKGVTIDLILREEKPKTVFIKHIYLD